MNATKRPDGKMVNRRGVEEGRVGMTIRRAAARARGPLAALFEEALEAEILLAEGRGAEALDRYRRVVGSGALLDELFATYSSSGATFRDGLARAHRAVWDQAGEAADPVRQASRLGIDEARVSSAMAPLRGAHPHITWHVGSRREALPPVSLVSDGEDPAPGAADQLPLPL